MFSSITIVGYIGKTDLQYVKAEGEHIARLKFTVAVDEITGRGESRKKSTTWYTVTLWRREAENLYNILREGYMVLVSGSLKASAYLWNGEARTSLEIAANTVQVLYRPPSKNPPAKSGLPEPETPPASEDAPQDFPF